MKNLKWKLMKKRMVEEPEKMILAELKIERNNIL